MKKVIRFSPALIAGVAFLFAGTAQAADRGEESWSGAYVGAVGGVQWTRSHFALPGDQADALVSDHDTRSSWFGGGMIGASYQTGGAVLGLEADLVGENARQAVTACTVPDGCWTPAHDSFTTLNHLKERLTGHLRARAGIASGGNLFYVAGGYSVAKTQARPDRPMLQPRRSEHAAPVQLQPQADDLRFQPGRGRRAAAGPTPVSTRRICLR